MLISGERYGKESRTRRLSSRENSMENQNPNVFLKNESNTVLFKVVVHVQCPEVNFFILQLKSELCGMLGQGRKEQGGLLLCHGGRTCSISTAMPQTSEAAVRIFNLKVNNPQHNTQNVDPLSL